MKKNKDVGIGLDDFVSLSGHLLVPNSVLPTGYEKSWCYHLCLTNSWAIVTQ